MIKINLENFKQLSLLTIINQNTPIEKIKGIITKNDKLIIKVFIIIYYVIWVRTSLFIRIIKKNLLNNLTVIPSSMPSRCPVISNPSLVWAFDAKERNKHPINIINFIDLIFRFLIFLNSICLVSGVLN